MAVDMFLKLDGIKGESKDKTYAGAIDVLAWTWEGSQPVSIGGGGLGSGKANIEHFNITKYIDVSSPTLFSAMVSGKHIATGTLILRKAGATPLEYLTYGFTDVIISYIKSGATDEQAGKDMVTEQIGVAFSKIEMQYKEQASTGGASSTVKQGWDRVANKAV
jgi:type VI secretion system secreted protein Hcp